MQTEPPSTTAESNESKPKCFSRFIPHIVRVLMGIMFFLPGLNGFHKFIPDPKEPMSEGALALMGAFASSGYMFKLIFGTQLICGFLLLINRFVPLALAMIAPVIVNIVAFHLFLAPSGLVMAFAILAMEFYLAWAYRAAFCPMLRPRVAPGH
ncbi:MAG: hypothetical protein JWN25_3274 [Verrucomicrobiales bacterium]|nr:hypothetical protein [Verrucomicrobiales bacterium]